MYTFIEKSFVTAEKNDRWKCLQSQVDTR